MKRTFVFFLVYTSWQTGCSDFGGTVTTATLPLRDAKPSNEPNVVAVHTEQGENEQLCTGVLLLPNLVLTARHCLTVDRSAIESGNCAKAVVAAPDDDTSITVVTGPDIDLAFKPPTYVVSEAWLPDDQARLCGQDLALLYLTNPINARPVSITTNLPEAGNVFTAYGYGLADGDYGQQRGTKRATLTCVGKQCDDERLVTNEFLAQSGACEGDSGGPAIDATGRVFALASRSAADCNTTAYVTFTNHIDWLATATRSAAKEGDYALPKWVTSLASNESNDADTPSTSNENEHLHATGGCSFIAPEPHSRWAFFGISLVLFAYTRLNLFSKRVK